MRAWLVCVAILATAPACVDEEDPVLLAEVSDGKADGEAHRLLVTGERRLTEAELRGLVVSTREDGVRTDTGEIYVLDPQADGTVWAKTQTGLGGILLQTFFRSTDGGPWVRAELPAIGELTIKALPDTVTIRPYSSLFPTVLEGAAIEDQFPGYAEMMRTGGVEFGFFPIPVRFILAVTQTNFHFTLIGACGSNSR